MPRRSFDFPALRARSLGMTRSLRLPLFLDLDFRSVFQFSADGGVAAGDDLVARLHALLDLDVGRIGDAGFHFAYFYLAAALHEDDALQLLALLARFLLLPDFVCDLGAVV